MSTLCAFMEQMLRYNEGEMDAVFLQDFIKIQWPDNKVLCKFVYTLLVSNVCSCMLVGECMSYFRC